ncbi:NHL repeat-containing protein [Mucilaginibacter ginsenosidivorans]|uniref:Teneurin NHL domain-containing protein n=1 Tax=Mucilaginibacter ginsenosidivorans TaxID=398053 RepID=A0A5B8V0Z2_9SPHI|nr:NHL repeat-containing protein [Mucilaginibacter ginsenosidivorans]QEC64932.1 hypothetical protein FRZ54_20955 [Mucilaginibacter ginsenosidivorans]
MRGKLAFIFIAAGFLFACGDRHHGAVVTTFAGSGTIGAANGKASEASFANPMGIAVDSAGDIFIADSRNNLIRKISTDGVVTTLAGSGAAGAADGKAGKASFFFPAGLAVGSGGIVYVADTRNSLIRKIAPDGTVTTIAGALTPDTKNNPEHPERLDNPHGIVAGNDGSVYFTDWAKDVIRKIGPDGKMTTIAGTGEPGSKDGIGVNASFYLPEGIAVDGKGNLFIADTYNNMIRKMDPMGVVTTIAGKPAKQGKHNDGAKDGKGPAASFSHPCGIAVARNGDLYVADVGNSKIRKISPGGVVTTLAGTGIRGAGNGDALKATFNQPFGVAADKEGNIYVADYQNNLVRKISH